MATNNEFFYKYYLTRDNIQHSQDCPNLSYDGNTESCRHDCSYFWKSLWEKLVVKRTWTQKTLQTRQIQKKNLLQTNWTKKEDETGPYDLTELSEESKKHNYL